MIKNLYAIRIVFILAASVCLAGPVAAQAEPKPANAESADAELIEMDDISITADPEQAPPPTVESKSADAIDDMPTGGDPFDIVRFEDAVVEETVIADDNYTITDTVLGFTRNKRAFSVYGGDSDFNAYFFDFMRIPMNKHSESDAPIVSVWAIDRIDIWKGITPLERGPGIGGTFVAVPDEYMEKDRQFILSPDTSLVNFTWKQKLPGDSGFVLSASKSLTELFVPLVFKGYQVLYEVMGMPLFDDVLLIPSFGDLCARLFLKGDANRLDLDILGFYDYSVTNLDMAGRYDMSGTALPYFVSGGGKWTFAPSGTLANSLYAYSSWQDRNSVMKMDLDIEDYLRESLRRMGTSEAEIDQAIELQRADVGGTVQTEAKPRIRVFAAEGGDSLSWYPRDELSFTAGANVRYAFVDGQYEGFTHADLYIYGMTMNEDYEVPLVTMTDEVLRVHGFARASLAANSFSSSLGGAYTWFPLHDSFVPSLEADASWNVSESLVLAGRAGWSSAYYDEFAFAERRLNEEILGIEGKSSYASLPRSVSCTLDARYELDGANVLGFEPYFSFYYDLSGLALYATWIDPYKGDAGQNLFKQTSALDPDIGRSLGATLSWESGISREWNSKLSWTPASTQYRNRTDSSWFRSNNDVSQSLKYALMYQRPAGFEFTGTFNVYAGKPFTPEIVTAPGILAKELFNTAVDWVPRLSLGLNLKWRASLWKKLDGRYEFNCANVLAIFSPALKGMKEDAKQTAGASTSIFANREYEFFKTDLFQIAYAMGFKFGGTFFF